MKIKDKYDILNNRNVDEIKSQSTLYKHKKSGCEIFHLENEDENNLFCFAFKTPPEDSTGVAHILEHTVLCGSEKYPIKDPFMTIYKGSMQTYLNAMTYPDRTLYPASSVVKQDFYNIMKIYGDAVFFPLLKEEAFRQEGHRLQFNEKGELERTGIVFSEMKGNYSSHESIAAEWSFRGLFDQGPYQYDSGGDPKEIPNLTYQQFKDFHKKYYHPSNCSIFLYGSFPIEEQLEFLDENFLGKFDKSDTTIKEISNQPRWSKLKRMEIPAPVQSEDDIENGSTHSINWLTSSVENKEDVWALRILSFILLGTSSSPIQLVIQQSDLGEDISPISGLEMDLNEMIFTVAMRGGKKEESDKFENLILNELNRIVKDGLDKDLVEGSLRRVEFRNREIKGGASLALLLMKQTMRGWNYCEDPASFLEFKPYMDSIRKKVESGNYFESLIEKYLLNNSHKTIITVYPDKQYVSRTEEEEKKDTETIAKKMSKSDIENLEAENEKLEQFQAETDDIEVLKRIPFLKHEDIPKEVNKIEYHSEDFFGVESISHSGFTNGVSYLNLFFNIDDLSDDELKLLPLLSQIWDETGLEDGDYEELSRQISLNFGGLNSVLEASTPLTDNCPKRFMVMKSRFLTSQSQNAVSLFFDILTKASYENGTRIKELLLEARNSLRSELIPSGNQFADLRSASRFSQASALEELWYGVTQLDYLNSLLESPMESIIEKLTELKTKIFVKKRLLLNSIYDNDDRGILLDALKTPLTNLPEGSINNRIELNLYNHPTTVESFSLSSQVSFSSIAFEGKGLGQKGFTAQQIIAHILKTGYLWENVRMKGGAYGAYSYISGFEQIFGFVSYRDPVILPTLDAFRNSFEWLLENITENDLRLAQIAVIGREIKPLSPAEKGSIAVRWDLYGIDDTLRQNKRNEMLALNLEDVKKELKWLIESLKGAVTTVIAGKQMVESASSQMKELTENSIEMNL